MDKSELLDWLREENQQWEALLEQVGPARMELPGVNGDWSFKDFVAHLTGWHVKLVSEIRAANLGQPQPFPPWPADLVTEDAINAWIFETNRDRSAEDLLDDSRSVIRQLLAVIEELPDDVVIEKEWRLIHLGDQRFPAGEFFDHFHDDHEPDVRAWLAGLDA